MSKINLMSDQKTIRISELLIEDPRAFRILTVEAPERVEQKLRDAVTIGFLAIDRTQAANESDWVTQRLEQQILHVNYMLERRSQEVLDVVRNQFDSSKAGSLLAPVAELVQRTQKDLTSSLNNTVIAMQESQANLGKILDENFDPENRTSRVQQFTGQMNELAQRLQNSIDPSREGTVLKDFLNRFSILTQEFSSSPALQGKLDGLRDEVREMASSFKIGAEAERLIDEAKNSAINTSPAKGWVFEDQVSDALKSIASIRNDLIEVVGSQPGKGSSKKGDLVYYVSQKKCKIVYEMKDYSSSRFTFGKIKDLMEASKLNRDAIYGVFVAKDASCLPEGVGGFYISEDFCITTQATLEVAAKVAILIAHQKIARFGSDGGPDWLFIESNIEEIKSSIGELSDLESSCSTAERAIAKTADGIRRVSRGLLEKVEGLLAEAAKREAANG
jgi:hypothetical protein